MKILAIIVSYNFMPWMTQCLGSLRKSSVPVDVMVLDNASSDATVETIRTDYPEVKLVENGENLGFGRANNIGMLCAIHQAYDAVLLLNQDAWIDADVLEQLVAQSQSHPDYGILSPIHLTASRAKVEHGFAVYTGLNAPTAAPEAEVVSVPFIDAAIWFMPVPVLKKVGLFAPLFYHYGEDKDLANRVLRGGYRIGYLPHAFGCHDREFRVITKAAAVRSERVYMLSEFANVRYSLPRAFAMSVLASCKKVAESTVQPSRHAPLTAADHLRIAFELLRRTGEILRTRRQSKHVDLTHYQP